MLSTCICFFFFFQAEDGIRDRNVTGVQTCALPISPCATPQKLTPMSQCQSSSVKRQSRPVAVTPALLHSTCTAPKRSTAARSEERRVGKECRSRWSPDQYKKNKKDDGSGTGHAEEG